MVLTLNSAKFSRSGLSALTHTSERTILAVYLRPTETRPSAINLFRTDYYPASMATKSKVGAKHARNRRNRRTRKILARAIADPSFLKKINYNKINVDLFHKLKVETLTLDTISPRPLPFFMLLTVHLFLLLSAPLHPL